MQKNWFAIISYVFIAVWWRVSTPLENLIITLGEVFVKQKPKYMQKIQVEPYWICQKELVISKDFAHNSWVSLLLISSTLQK